MVCDTHFWPDGGTKYTVWCHICCAHTNTHFDAGEANANPVRMKRVRERERGFDSRASHHLRAHSTCTTCEMHTAKFFRDIDGKGKDEENTKTYRC